MDVNCVTVTRILSPVQSAFYMIEAYPQHCDAVINVIRPCFVAL